MVGAETPPASTEEKVNSSYFAVAYVALSVPIIGIGFAYRRRSGLRDVHGLVFTGCVIVLALGVLVSLRSRPSVSSSHRGQSPGDARSAANGLGSTGSPVTSLPHSAVSGSSSLTRWQSSSKPSSSRRGTFMQPGATFGARTGEGCAGETGSGIEVRAADELGSDLRRVQNERAMSPRSAAVALPLTSNEPQT